MRNYYLAQYLLQQKRLTLDELQELLPVAADAQPTLGIQALCHELCDADKLPTLLGLGEDEFVAVASTTGLLSDSKLEKLRALVPSESAKFLSAMLSTKMAAPDDLVEVWQQFSQVDEDPVVTMVKELAGEEMLLERDNYASYTEVFLHTLTRFMDTSAVITGAFAGTDSEKSKHLVSQQISGIGGMVAGIWADDDVFLEMARRYSHEELQTIDELAIDCLTEFLNVLNGLYIVNLATNELEADIETPRVAANVEPFGTRQLVLQVQTGIGAFALVLAADEFII